MLNQLQDRKSNKSQILGNNPKKILEKLMQ